MSCECTRFETFFVLSLFCEKWLDIKDCPFLNVSFLAPIKAVCSPHCEAWKQICGPLGLNCRKLTEDKEMDAFFEIHDVHLIKTSVSGTLNPALEVHVLEAQLLYKLTVMCTVNACILLCFSNWINLAFISASKEMEALYSYLVFSLSFERD